MASVSAALPYHIGFDGNNRTGDAKEIRAQL